MKSKLFLLVALLCQMTFAQVSDEGLVAYYPFNSDSRNQLTGGSAFDFSFFGTGNNPFYGPSGVVGGSITNNECLFFDANARALMTTGLDELLNNNPNQNLTISYWVNYVNVVPATLSFATHVEAFGSLFSRGALNYGASFDGTNFQSGFDSTFPFLPQTWYHICLVYNANNQTLSTFIDGVLIESISINTGTAIHRFNNRFVIGGGTFTNGTYNETKRFTGRLDEMYIFNRAITADEVVALSNKARPQNPNPSITDHQLLAYYPFDGNSLNAAPNGSAFDLTVFGNTAPLPSFQTNGGVTGGQINNSGCYEFNGGSSFVTDGFAAHLDNNPNQSLSVSYWVNASANTSMLSTHVEFFASLFGRSMPYMWGVSTVNGNFQIMMNNNHSLNYLNNWVHITLVFNASENTLSAYGNGNLLESVLVTPQNSIFRYNNRAVIGGGSFESGVLNTAKTFTGRIDEVYVFAKPLSPSEILALSQKQVPSSSCPPGDVTFTSQAEVNAFVAQYPDCTQIAGDLTIDGFDVTNLSNLGNLTSVTGDMNLYMVNSSASLTGLQNITTVGGRVFIEFQRPNVDYLSGLSSVGGLVVAGAGITNLNGLSNISGHIPGNLEVFNNPMTNLNGLNNISSVGNDLLINFMHGLTNLTGLNNITSVGKSLAIHFNNNLTSLDGLNNLTTIGDVNLFNSGFSLRGNPLLTNISALENVSNIVRGFNLWDNASLTNCAIAPVCNKLANSTTDVFITGNATGCESIAVVQAACEALSINGFDAANVTVFPIPFNDSLHVVLSDSFEGTIRVLDMTGKTLYVKPFSGTEIHIQQLGHLSKGMYILQIETNNGQSTSHKIVK